MTKHFNTYFLNPLKSSYANFEGRATRSEFWYFVLYILVITMVAKLIDVLFLNSMLGIASHYGATQLIFALLLLIPYLAISVRRLHDIGKSGWWLLIGLVPIIGLFVLIYFYIQESK